MQGVILGLSEVLNSATREQLARCVPRGPAVKMCRPLRSALRVCSYYGLLIPTVQQALCDDSAAVRAAAGAAFNQLFRGSGGADASSEILPALLSSLEGDLNALEGLKQARLKRCHAFYGPRLLCMLRTGPESAAQAAVQRAASPCCAAADGVHCAHPGSPGGGVWRSAAAAPAGAYAAAAAGVLLRGTCLARRACLRHGKDTDCFHAVAGR